MDRQMLHSIEVRTSPLYLEGIDSLHEGSDARSSTRGCGDKRSCRKFAQTLYWRASTSKQIEKRRRQLVGIFQTPNAQLEVFLS